MTGALYHVTVLSNFARAYDRYRRVYSKSAIGQSIYPDEFYLLTAADLAIGIAKASRLRDKLAIPGDALLAMEAVLPPARLRPNLRNGVGVVCPSPDLPISRLFTMGADGALIKPLTVEQAMAESLCLHARSFVPYGDIRPRSLSFLPIARGCDAACPFCFSDASASSEQAQGATEMPSVRRWVDLAHGRGARRAVITGGGEPLLMRWRDLLQTIHVCRSRFDTVVLITNGFRLASMAEADAADRLDELHDAGLSVLAVSRHHPDEAVNAELMKLKTRSSALMRIWSAHRAALPGLRLRLICVLQHGGVESAADIDRYVAWAASAGVEEICFKELYVSTSHESVYHSLAANDWSARHQVPLAIVHDWAASKGLGIVSHLPWGAPVFAGSVDGRPVSVAAYTEPSLFWERMRGIARSWNVMADGTCLASLEDRRSVVDPDRVGATT